MKIIFANNYYYLRGGSERVLFGEMELLASQGHEVIPFSRQYEIERPTLFSAHFPPTITYDNTHYFNRIMAAISIIYSIDAKRCFASLLHDTKPDIIHGHNIYGRLSTSIIDAARSRRIPMVITAHDFKLICPSYLMLRDGVVCERCVGGRYYHCLLKRCHRGKFSSSLVYTTEAYLASVMNKYNWIRFFLSPSKFLLEKLVRGGYPCNKLVHLPNFVDVNRFTPSFGKGRYILYAGRLSKEKGIITLLKAVEGLDVQLYIIGDGPLRQSCELFTSERNMTNVVFMGHKTGSDLEDIFKDALFVVCPSEWYENAPMSVLEAFAYGKPVIGSAIGGIPEMISDGKTGFLYPAGDVLALRERIVALLHDPAGRERMGIAARSDVEKKYSAYSHYAIMTDIYRSCL